MANANSLSPPSPQSMSLPQSSIVAAQRGGLLHGPFTAGAAVFGAIPTATQNFGQLQYQPQNMYLHQQHLAAQQAHFRYHQKQQQQQQQQQQAARLKKVDSQIDPALMLDESRAHSGIDLSLQGIASSSISLDLPMTSSLKRKMPHHNADVNLLAHDQSPSLAHIAQLHEQQLNQNARQSHLPQSFTNQQISRPTHNRTPAASDGRLNMAAHPELSPSHAVLQEHPTSSDSVHNEDFSGLLSLKAYVDDAGRHY